MKIALSYKPNILHNIDTEEIILKAKELDTLMFFNNNIPLTVNLHSFKAFLKLCEKVSILFYFRKDILKDELVLNTVKTINYLDLNPIV